MIVPTDPAVSGINDTTMKTLKISILGFLTALAIILLFCDCEKTTIWIATKVGFAVVSYGVAKLWKVWNAESIFKQLMTE